MGCKAITPHLVGLAGRLENAPFHLIASHCQRGEKADVGAYLASKGYDPSSPNFTVTSFGRHPKIKGNGYVPYYAVFDHHGNLVHHHMCGAYHGGDGLAMIEWVDGLLKDVPEVYLGNEPFEELADLAAEIERGKGMQKLERALTDVEPSGELRRLETSVRTWLQRELQGLRRMLASTPSAIEDRTKQLSKMLARTRFAAELDTLEQEFERDDLLRRSIEVEEELAKADKKLAKLSPCKSCRRQGVESALLSCPSCRAEQQRNLRKLADSLSEDLEGQTDLPIAQRLQQRIAQLGGPQAPDR